jgi:hypothetical protein
MKITELLIESVESYNQLDNEETYQKCLDSWTDYYGNEETAKSELGNYDYDVHKLHEKGGKVWRVIFANSPDEVNLKDLGNHWTTDSSNISDYVDQNWEYYGKDKKHVYVIEATIGPNNVSNELVDVSGNAHEKEVNIINLGQATYKLYDYSDKRIGKQVRENQIR